jgi:hypothetical protein
MTMTDRYTDNPFLRLLDCFVLDAIDMLDVKQRAVLTQLEPRLAKTFNMEGTWREMVVAQMNFSDAVPERIRQFWAGYQDAARQQGVPAIPDEFVVNFVDQNFPDIVTDRGGRSVD